MAKLPCHCKQYSSTEIWGLGVSEHSTIIIDMSIDSDQWLNMYEDKSYFSNQYSTSPSYAWHMLMEKLKEVHHTADSTRLAL